MNDPTSPIPRRRRLARLLIAAGWWGLVGWFVRETLRTRDAGAEHLIAAAALAYLAAWCPILALARWSPPGKLARFGACTASIAAAFLAVEIPAALGVVDYREVFHTPTPPWRRSGNLPDPDLLYARKPDQRLRLRFEGSDRHGLRDAPPATPYTCDVTLDGLGFRNPPGLEAADVVLVGDSFVEGLQVGDDELISTKLAERMGAPVANLGRTGYGPRQELAVLDRHAAGFRPRACVWFFYEGNDLQDLAAYESDRERVKALRPESPRRAWYGRSFVRNAAGWLTRSSARDATVPARERAGAFRDDQGASTPIYFSCGVHEGDAEAVPGRAKPETMARLKEVFAEAEALCRARGIELVVAFVPSKFRVYRDLCAFEAGSPCPGWPVDDLPNAVAKAAREASPAIEFVDLTPRLHAEAEAGKLVYLPDDTHWSADGHQVAALAIAERLDDRERASTDSAHLGAVAAP
ncbi:alginate O-acetyltransferase AlgX-related protein [Paludisphaera soli]|uniref:alginate O-acetyltransferase AlgX-related protein n=1 Tax=Paludisphaera soli TaxID=2712865 RepID=UPI0013EBFBE8|nr:hypothetical protein [Paludisphaera soli]